MRITGLSVVFAIVLALALLAGCSSYSSQPAQPTAPPSSPTAPTQAKVTISGFAFSPGTLQVARGATVTWTNNDSPPHTVTSDSGVFDSGNLASGATFSYTFNQTGTYAYYCKIHPAMTAKIVVE